MMKVVTDYPPNIEFIRQHFELDGNEIFTYGDTVYSPTGPISVWLIAHEKVHCRQQGADPDGWWQRYVDDIQFRFEQELQAHRAEYKCVIKHIKDINVRRKLLYAISRRLSSPLYGSLVSHQEALMLIANAKRKIPLVNPKTS
jgi:hypothetical protein